MRTKVAHILHSIAFLLFLVILGAVAWFMRDELALFFQSPERLGDWVENLGALGSLVYIGLQFVQVLIFILPGEVVQIAGGYLFGVFWGTIYSLIGIGLGMLCNYGLARLWGRSFVQTILKPETVDRFHRAIASKTGAACFLLLFLIPGVPKDVLAYVAGSGGMHLGLFMVISLVGRLPALIGSMTIGAATAGGNWLLAIILSTIAVLLFLTGVLLRRPIQDRILRRRHTIAPDIKSRSEPDEHPIQFDLAE